MKIIKQHGKYKKDSELSFEKFECENCGCVFFADNQTYWIDNSRRSFLAKIADCPECGSRIKNWSLK